MPILPLPKNKLKMMSNTKILIGAILLLFMMACGGEKKKPEATTSPNSESSKPAESQTYDPKRGEGKFSAENVILDATLNAGMASEGDKIQGVKCASCHKLSDERLVGPGWKGVTQRQPAHWIMNFITNPDPMIDKDPELQAQLEICLVRMPNQSLSDTDARNILEFMRKNDGVK